MSAIFLKIAFSIITINFIMESILLKINKRDSKEKIIIINIMIGISMILIGIADLNSSLVFILTASVVLVLLGASTVKNTILLFKNLK